MGTRKEWEEVRELGSGGQSTVYLVRRPSRVAERRESVEQIWASNPWATMTADTRPQRTGQFAEAVVRYARLDFPSELGAMKVFKLREAGPEGEQEAVSRLTQEITVLQQGRKGLPELLDSNEAEGWIVTEYFPELTLEHHPEKFKGNAALALRAFRSLVETVASLHKDGFVHRDIKPANVFIRKEDELVLGDFGIVYAPNSPERVTQSLERVGPRDYMPQWANLGVRHEKVQPNFDVYMLGKLLWSMVDGRPVLPREFYQDPEYDFDLTRRFPNDPQMYAINRVLAKCVVERPRDCLSSAVDLLSMVNALLSSVDRGGQLLSAEVPRPCHVCGVGFYQASMFPATQPAIPKEEALGLRFWFGRNEIATVRVHPFICDNCGHVELFTRSQSGS